MRWNIGVALLCLLAPALGGAVTKLSSLSAFEEFRSQHATFALLVYAPWCGHSRTLLPEFEQAASSSSTPFVKVDGTEAEELATYLDVKGYPTLFFVYRGDGEPIEYDGARTAQAITSWVAGKVSPTVGKLTSSAEVLSFAKGKPVALVLFLPAGDAAGSDAEALRAVAASAADMPCAIATSDPTDGALGLGSSASAAPVLVAFTSHAPGYFVLPPPLSHASMLRFGRAHALPAVVAYAPGAVEEALFSSQVGAHLLFFHSGPVDDAVGAALAEAGAALRGKALVATIDAGAHAEVATFFDVGPSGALPTPTLMGFSLANGTKFAHTGALTSSAMMAFVDAVLGGAVAPHLRSQPEPAASGPLMELVGSSFSRVAFDRTKDVLVQFYSPTCGHCAKLAPVYEQVAAKFAEDETMVVAKMDAVANDVAGLEPEGFPTIVLYSKANKEGVEYDGSRDAHDLIQFIEDARAGRNHVGGLPAVADGSAGGSPDEDDGYRVEL